jgi:hypothetical protein
MLRAGHRTAFVVKMQQDEPIAAKLAQFMAYSGNAAVARPHLLSSFTLWGILLWTSESTGTC